MPTNNYGNLPVGMNPQTLYDYWDKLDNSLTDEQKAGILGNLWEESKFNPNTVNGGLKGLNQMDSNIMKQFPANYGAWNNADNVFRYINDYATGRTPKIKKGMGKDEWSGNLGYRQNLYRAASHKTAADSARAWHTYYERAGAGYGPRVAHANLIYAHMKARNAQPKFETVQPSSLGNITIPQITMSNDATTVAPVAMNYTVPAKKLGGKLKRHINYGNKS